MSCDTELLNLFRVINCFCLERKSKLRSEGTTSQSGPDDLEALGVASKGSLDGSEALSDLPGWLNEFIAGAEETRKIIQEKARGY